MKRTTPLTTLCASLGAEPGRNARNASTDTSCACPARSPPAQTSAPHMLTSSPDRGGGLAIATERLGRPPPHQTATLATSLRRRAPRARQRRSMTARPPVALLPTETAACQAATTEGTPRPQEARKNLELQSGQPRKQDSTHTMPSCLATPRHQRCSRIAGVADPRSRGAPANDWAHCCGAFSTCATPVHHFKVV